METAKMEALLKSILQAEYGAVASRLKRCYCETFAPFLKGERILFGKYGSDAVIHGIVELVKYNNAGFRYMVRECTKDWEYRKRRNPIWVEKKDAIKKAME